MQADFVPLSVRLRQVAAQWFECERSLKGRDAASCDAKAAVCRVLTDMGWSSARIGKRLGYDHSTVLHHLKRSEALVSTSRFYAAGLEKLRVVSCLYLVAYPKENTNAD